VVNAAGPWIDRVLGKLGRSTGVGVERSKGVHILTRPLGGPGRVTDAVFARAPSGRHVIVSPWAGRSFIGPTDTPIPNSPTTNSSTPGDESSVVVDPDDIDLILDTVNSTMSGGETPLKATDVELATVGVRPLIRQERIGQEESDDSGEPASTYSASRAHEFYHHTDRGIDNLWTIGGGKWTTARATAEQMVEKLLDHEFQSVSPRVTSTRRVAAAGSFAWAEDAEPYLEDVVQELGQQNVPAEVAQHLARLYGTEWRLLSNLLDGDGRLAQRISTSTFDIAVQVVFAVVYESARTLSDIVDRRLVLGTVGSVRVDAIRKVANIAGPLWGWDEQRIENEVRREFDRREVIESHWRTPLPSRIRSRSHSG
jgi:glycerol-3-phosphate dehydrogenase